MDKPRREEDRILKQVFGEEATFFVYKYLEQRYSLHQKDLKTA